MPRFLVQFICIFRLHYLKSASPFSSFCGSNCTRFDLVFWFGWHSWLSAIVSQWTNSKFQSKLSCCWHCKRFFIFNFLFQCTNICLYIFVSRTLLNFSSSTIPKVVSGVVMCDGKIFYGRHKIVLVGIDLRVRGRLAVSLSFFYYALYSIPFYFLFSYALHHDVLFFLRIVSAASYVKFLRTL